LRTVATDENFNIYLNFQLIFHELNKTIQVLFQKFKTSFTPPLWVHTLHSTWIFVRIYVYNALILFIRTWNRNLIFFH